MKRLFPKLFLLFACMGPLFSCTNEAHDDSIDIVVSIYPEFEWMKAVIKDVNEKVNLTLLMDSGSDLHSFQPTIADIGKIQKSDLFVYVGGESDEWVGDVMENKTNKDLKTISLVDVLGDKARDEERVTGMQDHEEGGDEKDEHVWLSLRNASLFVDEFAKAMGEIDGSHADSYRKNADEYKAKLSTLDERYGETVSNSPNKTLLFADRFPFLYLTKEYGINYYAAFSGCSAETEASLTTIKFLVDKIDELGLRYVMKIDGSGNELPNAVINSTKTRDQKILTLDSIQSTTTKSNASYLSIMESNLKVLEEALS